MPGYIRLFAKLTSSNEAELPKTLNDLCQEMYSTSDKASKLWKLVEWGNCLTESLSVEERTAKHRVTGCLSVAYIKVIVQDEKVYLTGFADSKIARGLVFLLVRGLQGTTVHVVRTLASETIVKMSGLENILSSSRMGGIESLLRHIQQQCNLSQNSEQVVSSFDSHTSVDPKVGISKIG